MQQAIHFSKKLSKFFFIFFPQYVPGIIRKKKKKSVQVFILGRAQGAGFTRIGPGLQSTLFQLADFFFSSLWGSLSTGTQMDVSFKVYVNSGNWLHCKGSHAARASSCNNRGKSQGIKEDSTENPTTYSNAYFCSGLIPLAPIMIWDYSFSGEISSLRHFLFGKMVIENCFIWAF